MTSSYSKQKEGKAINIIIILLTVN